MDHFIPLVKALKSKANIYWADVMAWYGEHYYMPKDEEQFHPRYVSAISRLLIGYLQEKGLITMKDMVDRLSPDYAWHSRIWLNPDHTEYAESTNETCQYHLRVIGACCSMLILTIPASVWGEEYNNT